MNAIIRILHLEDDPADAELVRVNLADADMDYHISVVQTRDAFETALNECGVDIILGDFQLPMFDGISALQLARKQCPDVPFIFVSGTMGEEAAIAALTQGATDYVLKQNLSRLPTAVQRALREVRHRHERKQAEQQVALMSFALNGIHEAAFMIDEKACFQYVNNAACQLLGYTHDELLTMSPLDINPDFAMEKWPGYWSNLKNQGAIIFEGELKTKNGRFVPVEVNANYFEYEGRSYDLGLVRDITDRKQAERERLANLRFFESMDSVNRAIQEAGNIEDMMKNLLEIVLSIFDCDRAFLLYPCDPDAPTWEVPMERNKPEYRGVRDLKLDMRMTPQFADNLRTLLNTDGPVMFGPDMPHNLIKDVSQQFNVQSMMAMAIYPKTDRPWEFGIHQCSHTRVWSQEEEKLLQEIGRRLEIGLTSMLAYRNLRESEAKYRQIVDTANEGIWAVGPDNLTTFVNARMAEMIGWTAIDMIGRSMAEFIFAEDMPDHKRIMEHQRQGQPVFYERRFRHKDGRIVWTHASATPTLDGEHHFNGAFVMFTDITENKQAQIRLSEQLLFLQQLLDSIPIPVYYKDAQGSYLGCNAAYEVFVGLSRQHIVGKTVYDVVPKARADKHHEMDVALLSQPGVQTYEISTLDKDGKHREVIFHKATYVDVNDCVAGTVGALVDITDRKQAERERLANLRFFECMDRVHQAIQGADDPEDMMKDLLDVVMSIFDSDRAFLLYPCDPESPAWSVPMERKKPEHPRLCELNGDIPMDSEVAEKLRIQLAEQGPVKFGPGTPYELTDDMSERSNIKSMMSMAIYPKTGSPWQFGIHQCAYPCDWTEEEMRIFEAIGRRLADGLSSLLTQRDLRQNEEFLDKIVEHIPDMIFVKEAQNLSFVRFNKAGEQLIGRSREDLIGKTDHDLFSKKEADFFTEKDRQVLERKELVDIPEEIISNRSNQNLILHTKKIPIFDKTGAPQYLLGISEDITERKQAEQSIRKLSQAVEQSPVSIVITDVDGKIEFVNAKFTQVTGYSFDEALGQNPRILKSGETPAEEYRQLWRTIISGGIWQGAIKNRKKNGELFWEQATIAPIRDANNAITHYVAVKEDITERKELESRLRQIQKMEAIGQLAGGIAHDFNNILSAITGYTELSIATLEPETQIFQFLTQVMEASKRAKDLINQIMMFSRETNQELKPIRIDFPVKEALKLIRASVPATIEMDPMIQSNGYALADPTQIHQIVMNLCTNAAQAMKDNGGILEVHLTDTTLDHGDNRKYYPDAEPGEYIRLTVSDQGDGIDAQYLHRIFDPFFTTKKRGEGTGMGLSVVHGIVKSCGGFIYVNSQLGEGTTFEILIPAQEHTAARPTIQKKPIPTGSESILFVDDEVMIVDIAKKMLQTLGYRVIARTSAIEALEAFKNNPENFDLVVTDLTMPKLTGLDLAEKIFQIRPGFPMVLCTGFDITIDETKIAERGFLGIVYKPILRRDMAIVVRTALDDSRFTKDIY
jgi:PAS domain S-box-containing protein